jgi:serine/threonine protein kinase
MSELAVDLHPDLRDLVGTTIADRYRIDSVLGVGGMAVVFKAHHLGLKRDLAVKVLHPSFLHNEEISARFEREAESASRLDHPNCVQVTDFGSTKTGLKFMVMQLLEGRELSELLVEPMDPLRCVEMVVQVARGLEHAHKKGVVHRDIKPENVFITTNHAGREVLKLVDFGISKIEGGSSEGHKTTVGLIFGTPAYMSPEQAAGMEADSRADLYSLGIIMYQMLAGRLPFEADDPVALCRMQVGRDPDPLPGHVPPVLSGVVQRLLMKDRDERFSSATELIVTLENVWTLLGGIPNQLSWSTSTGPIDLGVTGSGAISLLDSSGGIPLSTITGERELISGPRALMRPPTPEPEKPKGRKGLYFVAGLIVVAGVAAAFFRFGDGAAVLGRVAEASRAEAGEAADPGEDEEDIRVGVDALTLAQIDKLIIGENLDDADKLLSPLRDEFPDDPELLWRAGRIFAKRRRKEPEALTAYSQALERDPSLLDNKDFYAELYELMERRRARDQALDLALQKLGTQGHKFLLQVVNDEKRPLDYHDRERALEELQKDPVNRTLINVQLNVALDLLQAAESLTPCENYSKALEAIAAAPDYWFHRRVDKATLPTSEIAQEKGEDPAACEGLAERRQEVLEMLAALEPEGEAESDGTPANAIGTAKNKHPSPEPEPTPPPEKPAPATTKSTKKNSRCTGWRAKFRKECRKKK